jgi:hypothetical protein
MRVTPRAWAIALMFLLVPGSLLIAVSTPLARGATECVGFSDDLDADDLHGATLVFTGTVMASSAETSTASFKVDRVWKGDVRRDTTLFIYAGVEEIRAEAFRSGAQYLLFMHQPVEEFRKEDLKAMGLPQGTLGVWLGCGEMAMLSEAVATLKRLGRSEPPRR